MAFTFTIPFDDIARVRFAIGDTDADAHRFEDELLTELISTGGSWQAAAVAAVDAIIAELASTPAFTADWLKVDTASAIKHYRELRMNLTAQLPTVPSFLSGAVIVPVRSDRDEQQNA